MCALSTGRNDFFFDAEDGKQKLLAICFLARGEAIRFSIIALVALD